MILQWIRFGVISLLLASGLCVAAAALLGIFRFHFALNRMQAASVLDTFAMLLVLLAMAVSFGVGWTTAKIVLIIFFMWVAGPVSTHLLTKLEAVTDPELGRHMTIEELDDLERELEESKEAR